jgi:hypothetical protein
MKATGPAGYSGTPLAKKLGYRDGNCVFLLAAPKNYSALVYPLPPGIRFDKAPGAKTDLVHAFFTEKAELSRFLASARRTLQPDASIWVSWPKKSSKVQTTITEDTIRELALPLGFVDIKVCAVDDTWSGLKLVVRRELRC